MKHLLLEKKSPLAWLILNRPKKRNALSLKLMYEITEQLNILSKDEDVRVIVIKGNGSDFCAGHDIEELVGKNHDIHYFRKIFTTCTKMMQTFHQTPQPIIAQVHGVATAAGCQLVATCDLAIAESDAKFATPGVKIGLFCSTPMVPLCRIIGRRRALDMLLTGRFVPAEEAKKFGLINKVVTPDRLAEKTKKWAMEIAQHSKFILEFGKKTFYKQIDQDETSAYKYATEAIAKNCLAEEAQNGMKAFLQRYKLEWKKINDPEDN